MRKEFLVLCGVVIGLALFTSAHAATIMNNEVIDENGTYALRAGTYTASVSLAANTAESVTIPTWTTSKGATKRARLVYFASTANFYATYGSDVVTNGTFAANESWTLGTGWDIAGGVGAANDSNDSIQQDASLANDSQSYLFTFTTTAVTNGSVTAWMGGTYGTDRTGNDTYAETIVMGTANDSLGLRGNDSFIGNVDNVSAYPIATIPGDITTGVAPEINPTVRIISKVTRISLIAPTTCVVTMQFFK